MAGSLGRIWAALSVAAALAAGSPALAADRLSIKPWLSVSQEYDDNVLYSARHQQGDWFTRISPTIQISRRGDRQNLLLRGKLDGRTYRKYDEFDVLNPSLHFDADREITRRFTIFLNGNVIERKNTDPVEEQDTMLAGRADLSRYLVQGGFGYVLDALTTLRLTISALEVDYGERKLPGGGSISWQASDYDGQSALLVVQRVLSSRDVVGFWVSHDTFDFRTPPEFGGIARAAREDRQMRLGVTWRHTLSPTWSITARGGPRWLRSDGGEITSIFGLPLRTPNRSVDSTAFNGDLTLTKVTPISRFELRLSRDTRPSSDRGASQNEDTIAAALSRRIGRRFNLQLSGLWVNEESASEMNIVQRTTVGVSAELSWRIRQNLYTFVGYTFRDQETDRTLQSASTQSQRFRVGFRYGHDLDVF